MTPYKLNKTGLQPVSCPVEQVHNERRKLGWNKEKNILQSVLNWNLPTRSSFAFEGYVLGVNLITNFENSVIRPVFHR